jgi:hypothetical protein
MRISGSLTNPVAAITQPAAQSPGIRRAAGDQAEISDAAKRLLSATQMKLAQLQAARDTGTYHVSPSQIARSIINAHLK